MLLRRPRVVEPGLRASDGGVGNVAISRREREVGGESVRLVGRGGIQLALGRLSNGNGGGESSKGVRT